MGFLEIVQLSNWIGTHGSPSYAVLGVEITTLVCLMLTMHEAFKTRSGLNDAEKIQTIWSRAHQIHYQPVFMPILFALAVGLGSQGVLRMQMMAMASIINLEGEGITGLIGFVSLASSRLILMTVYRKSGGQNWKRCVGTAILCEWLISIFFEVLPSGIYKEVSLSSEMDSFLVVSGIHLVVMTIQNAPFYFLGSRLTMADTCDRIEPSTSSSDQAAYNHSLISTLIPQAFAYIISFICQMQKVEFSYLARITVWIAPILNFIGASLTSIMIVNRELHFGNFQWQWLAFLAPALLANLMDSLAILGAEDASLTTFISHMNVLAYNFFVCGSSGVLANYAFMSFADQLTKTRLAEDKNGKQE